MSPSFVSTPGMWCQVTEALRGLLKATEFDFFQRRFTGSQSDWKPFQDFKLFPFFPPFCFSFHPPHPCQTLSPFVRMSISTFSIPFSSSFQYLPPSFLKKKSPPLGTQGRTKRPSGKDGISVHFPQNHPHSLLPKRTWEEFPMQPKANPATVWVTSLPPPFHSLPHTHTFPEYLQHLTNSLTYIFWLPSLYWHASFSHRHAMKTKYQNPTSFHSVTLSLVFSLPFIEGKFLTKVSTVQFSSPPVPFSSAQLVSHLITSLKHLYQAFLSLRW